jgi:hypothetical protein
MASLQNARFEPREIGIFLPARRQGNLLLSLRWGRPNALLPQSPSNGRASFRRSMAEEDQGGGSRRPTGQEITGAVDNFPGPRDPPIGRSGERPSLDGLWGVGALTPPIRRNGFASTYRPNFTRRHVGHDSVKSTAKLRSEHLWLEFIRRHFGHTYVKRAH